MSRPERATWVWREVWWPHPFSPDTAVELLDRLAADHQIGEVVWEARATGGHVRYLVGVRPPHSRDLLVLLTNLIPGVRSDHTKRAARSRVDVAGHLTASRHALALNVERVTAITRAVLAGLATANGEGEELILQVILGGRLSPQLVSPHAVEPKQSWFDLMSTSTRPSSAEARASMKTRASLHGYKLSLRIGAMAGTQAKLRTLVTSVLGGLRVAEAAGVRLHLTLESPAKLNGVQRPWRWPMQLSARELVALMGWPLGSDADGDLPGQPGAHPRIVAPPARLPEAGRPFAVSTAPGENVRFGIASKDSLQHTVLLGPTSSGKSTAMLALIMDAIHAGRSVLVIDPKTDLVNDVLARVPETRKDDVVVIDPTEKRPVGLNPLKGAGRNAELVADSILAVFKELYADSWGPRTQDVLTSALITLAHHKGATLTMLPSLLTDDRFRKKFTRGLKDQLGLGTFWSSYEAMSAEQRAQVIAPVMNKLRQFLLRPSLRAVLGQADPVFDLSDLFTKRRIVLVSLNKGLIGSEGARLLGALVVSQLWPLTLGRAAVAPERRHVVNVFIDEVQDYLALPTDLEDALSQARGLGVGFTIAHQYRKQLPVGLRAGIDANARNKIIFGLNADDASDLARQAPGLEAQDFMLLPRFGIYSDLISNGERTGWFSARTLPPSTATADPVELRVRSAATYGRDAEDVENGVLEAIGLNPNGEPRAEDEPIGRRKAPRGGES